MILNNNGVFLLRDRDFRPALELIDLTYVMRQILFGVIIVSMQACCSERKVLSFKEWQTMT
jgi:hypothetical protein